MRNASAATIALLATGHFYLAEIYTITLAGGTVLRYSAAPTDITVSATTWSRTPLKFQRGNTKTSVGLQTDSFDVTIFANPDDSAANVQGVSLEEFIRAGGLDGATLQIDRVFMPTWGDTSGGAVVWFYGLVSDTQPGRTKNIITVKDLTERLNLQWPRNVYQPPCIHTLYDAGCTLLKASFLVSGTVASGATVRSMPSNLTQAADYFALGFIIMTSGALNGQKRFIKSYTGGAFTFAFPMASAPAAGDTFSAYPGCDKTQATCTTKFSNLANFRGFPYVPIPETAQ